MSRHEEMTRHEEMSRKNETMRIRNIKPNVHCLFLQICMTVYSDAACYSMPGHNYKTLSSYLFIYLFISLFIYLFIYLFIFH